MVLQHQRYFFRQLMKELFSAWRLTILLQMAHVLAEQLIIAQQKISDLTKAPSSIWKMNKEQLVEYAFQEFACSRSLSEAMTVTVLREKLRQAKEQALAETDLNLILPKGLEKLHKDELQQEMMKRNLSFHDPNKNRPMTRPQMIVMIRDHVATCQAVAEPPSHLTQANSTIPDLSPFASATSAVHPVRLGAADSAQAHMEDEWTLPLVAVQAAAS